jgi:hypothetical protein
MALNQYEDRKGNDVSEILEISFLKAITTFNPHTLCSQLKVSESGPLYLDDQLWMNK